MISELRPGLQFQQYQLLEQIGVGGQGVVWSAEDLQRNDIVAIKFNKLQESENQQADDQVSERQLGKLLQVRHAHILPVYDYGFEDRVLYLVSPYISGGSVFERIKSGSLPLEEALRYSAEIASALDYLHGQGIIHRDIKSPNILLNLKSHTYLADFGLARSVSETTQVMHTGRGTPPYAPPEQHKRLEITPKSDIYSFGILLFEIFAGQLPWGGETILGIQQLYSNSELPDPCELNTALPPLMKDVLRHVTAAEPARRPASAGEVMKMLYYIFKIKDFPLSNELIHDRAAVRAYDSNELFNQKLARWAMDDGKSDPGLTKFALIHLGRKAMGENTIQGGVGQFMLFHALLYSYNEDYWWSKVANFRDRLTVSARLLTRQNEVLADRVLGHLVTDPNIQKMPAYESANIVTSLLEVAVKSANPKMSRKLLAGLQALIPAATAWGSSTLSPELNQLLGELAMEDSDAGDQAARLVGHLHSQPALNFILNHADKSRLTPALLEVHRSAGHLPSFVMGSIRLRVTLEWIIDRLTIQPARLFGAYMLAWLGATLGIGAQAYLTVRAPEFLDTERISSSLLQGLITGAIFSLGILLTRVIVERFAGSRVLPRLLLGTFAGAVGMNTALFIFHVLFVNTTPSGFLITLGCAVIAFAYALGGLARWRWVGMILSVTAVAFAIISTWWVHANMAASITELTPLFRYEYNWSMSQVFFTALIVAACMGIFGNLIGLAAREE